MQKLKFQEISNELIQGVLASSSQSSRKRSNYNFHEYSENYQRFLNVLIKGTYICPHKHALDPKAETFLILKGKVVFFIFDDNGSIIHKSILSNEGPIYGIDVQPNVWHSLVCLSENAICFEGKTGPYNPSTDKEFAPWAPTESNIEEANKYLNHLYSMIHD